MIAADVQARLEETGGLEPRLTAYVPHAPTPKQAAFLSPIVTVIPEVFFGGAAGGGKSDALLMAALQFVDVPGYAALLLRKDYKRLSLPGALMSRAQEWLGPTDARWTDTTHTWTFPSGATLTFGYLEHADDIYRYGSSEFQFIGFDELTEFSEAQYRFLFSRGRAPAGINVPIRMRSASNPVGTGKQWVHRRFVLNGPRYGRLFIPSRLEDNPYLDQESYDRALRQLGSIEYRQLRYGDWTVRPEGKTFKRAWFEVVPPTEVTNVVGRVRYWDLAATDEPRGAEARKQSDPDWTAGLRLARSKAGIYYVVHVERFRGSASKVEERIARVAANDGKRVPILMEQEPGSSGKSLISYYRRNVLDGYDFRGVPSTGSKEVRANPVAARAEAGEIKLVEGGWVEAFLDEAAEFPDGLHDDQVDALSGAYAALALKGPRTRGAKPSGMKAASYWRDA